MTPSDERPPVVDESGSLREAAVKRRIEELIERARTDAAEFEEPSSPPDRTQAMEYLRSGVGQVVGLYLQTRTGGRFYHFTDQEWDRLEEALNTWLELYAACHGVELNANASIRTAAEALLDTDNIAAVARTLTGVPTDGSE